MPATNGMKNSMNNPPEAAIKGAAPNPLGKKGRTQGNIGKCFGKALEKPQGPHKKMWANQDPHPDQTLGTRILPGILPGRSYRVTGYSKLTGKMTILTG